MNEYKLNVTIAISLDNCRNGCQDTGSILALATPLVQFAINRVSK